MSRKPEAATPWLAHLTMLDVRQLWRTLAWTAGFMRCLRALSICSGVAKLRPCASPAALEKGRFALADMLAMMHGRNCVENRWMGAEVGRSDPAHTGPFPSRWWSTWLACDRSLTDGNQSRGALARRREDCEVTARLGWSRACSLALSKRG